MVRRNQATQTSTLTVAEPIGAKSGTGMPTSQQSAYTGSVNATHPHAEPTNRRVRAIDRGHAGVPNARPTDVKVVETRRPNPTGRERRQRPRTDRPRPVGVQLFATLRELQLLVVEITNGLVQIGQPRGIEGR